MSNIRDTRHFFLKIVKKINLILMNHGGGLRDNIGVLKKCIIFKQIFHRKKIQAFRKYKLTNLSKLC
jgi:hypothetical protein